MSGSASAKPDQFPSLQISDLLVLTSCVSFALMFIEPSIRDTLALPDANLWVSRWRLVLPEIIEHLAFGITLFGVIVLARQRLRGSCPMSPGHWLFVATGPWAFMRLLAETWREVLSVYWLTEPPLVHAIDDGLFALAFGMSFVLTLRSMRTIDCRWRLFLVLIAVWLLVGFAWCVLEVVQSQWLIFRQVSIGVWTTAWLLAFVTACVIAAIEANKGIRRDW